MLVSALLPGKQKDSTIVYMLMKQYKNFMLHLANLVAITRLTKIHINNGSIGKDALQYPSDPLHHF